LRHGKKEELVGVGRYFLDKGGRNAELAFVVRDDYQNKGIAGELMRYLTYLGKKQGLFGFTAEVLVENKEMLHLFYMFEKMGFRVERRIEWGTVYLNIAFETE
jgi:GNAT superfamily N-acetyltransferase